MKRIPTLILAFWLALSLAVVSAPAAVAKSAGDPQLRAYVDVDAALAGTGLSPKGTPLGGLRPRPRIPGDKGVGPADPSKGGSTCITEAIACDSTVTGTLQMSDCEYEEIDGSVTYMDFWSFNGTAGDLITVQASAADYATYIILIDQTVADDPIIVDSQGDGVSNDVRLDRVLEASGEWVIGVNNFNLLPSDPGDYTLSLDCGGTLTPPAAPTNLTASATSSTEIEIFWDDNSNNEADFEIQLSEEGGEFQTIGALDPNSFGAVVFNLDPETTYSFRVRARNGAGNSDWSNVATATTEAEAAPATCVSTPTAPCLNNGRFRVEIEWTDFNGDSGFATEAISEADSAVFYFFTSENWEMLVKVLDGCAINNSFWVFAAATTNVEYTLRVTDTETDTVKEYFNPLGQAAPAITDTAALATCP